ncbi:MAG: YwaF family protein [Clostridia bacterium]|nr:YwaF family protein [Clostridia bacterium]
MKDFFGFGGYTRPAEGFLSWQHLTFVTLLMTLMTVLAVIIGKKHRGRNQTLQNKPLIVSAILIDTLELFKIILISFRAGNAMEWLYMLPLFLCSIQLITIPLAAFSKGRLKEVALDFVLIFGILGAIFGTYGAGNNYSAYPVLSFDNIISGITHAISGFASLYIAIVGMASMKKKNLPFSFAILCGFCLVAYITNLAIDYNYMFLMQSDGTPYEIFYQLVNGSPVLYPITVVLLFLLYISAFYACFYLIVKKRRTVPTPIREEVYTQ